jgi:AcrR family transcriptional regulator
MPKSLQSRKRQLVRDAIFDAAIDLFAAKGFDETTVEEVAQAAGISRRSFFRYFESKDDLLAYSIVNCGVALSKKVAECPEGLSPLGVVRKATQSVAEQMETSPRMRQMVEIAERSVAARQANLSRLAEAQDSLAEAFAKHFKSAPKHDFEMRLLASLTFQTMVESTLSWSRSWSSSENQSISSAAKQALNYYSHLFCDKPVSVPTAKSASKSKNVPDAAGRHKSGL